ncbi:MAG: UvrD-helicase domain-containing protein [Chlorobi bacterium]|nr:UvrD-helicase domain-containing protein [Chlorobiota bacterium]
MDASNGGSLFRVVSASAGSGKTYTLTLDVLERLLRTSPETQGRYLRKILALTFTNKAAAEMAEALRKRLGELARFDPRQNDSQDDSLMNYLKKRLHLPAEEISRRAAFRLAELLFQADDLYYTTIDSFVLGLIRQFARETGLGYNVEVEMNQEEATDLVIDDMMGSLREDSELFRKLMIELEQDWEKDGKGEPEKYLKRMIRYVLPERYWEKVKILSNLLSASNEQKPDEGKNIKDPLEKADRILKEWEEIPELLENEWAEWEGKYGEKLEKIIGKINGNSLNINNLINRVFTASNLRQRKLFSNEPKKYFRNFFYHSPENWPLKKNEKLTPEELAVLHTLPREEWLVLVLRFLLAGIFGRALSSLRFFRELGKAVENFKRENHVLFISDIHKKMHEITDGHPAPYVYFRSGLQFSHQFLDEFQDTSRLQWKNLKPLLEEVLAHGGDGAAFGDAKQSIYHFRGADPDLFLNLKECTGSPTDDCLQGVETRTEKLEKNWRSDPHIVAFNNCIFEEIFNDQPATEDCDSSRPPFWFMDPRFKNAYKNAAQIPAHIPEEEARFWREKKCFKHDDALPGAHKYEHPGYVEVHTGTVADMAEAAAGKVKDILDKESHPIAPDDICILVHENDQASRIGEKLQEKGIDFITEKALSLGNAHEVVFMVELYRYVCTGQASALQEALLRYWNAFLRRDDEEDEEKNVAPTEWFVRFDPGARPPEVHFSTVVSELSGKADLPDWGRLNVPEFFTALAGLWEWDKGGSSASVKEFLSVLHREASRLTSSGDFLRYWDKVLKNREIQIPEAPGKVRIMTVHKAKGLEFPVVIYAYADEKLFELNPRKPDYIWLETGELLQGLPHLPVTYSDLNKIVRFSGIIYNSQAVEEIKDESLRRFLKHTYEVWKAFLTRKIFERVNLKYVAFTRARNRLYVLAQEEETEEDGRSSRSKKNGKKTIPHIPTFRELLEDRLDLTKAARSEEDGIYRRGKPEPLPPKKKSADHSASKITTGFRAKADPYVNPLIRLYEPRGGISDKGRALLWGTKLHDYLSQLECRKDLERVRKAVERREHPEEAERLKKILERLTADPRTSLLFDCERGRILTERPLLAEQIYRPDRLVQSEDGTWLIADFKTGSPRQEDVRQVQAYAYLMEEGGYPVKGAWLIYAGEEEIRVEEVPLPMSPNAS